MRCHLFFDKESIPEKVYLREIPFLGFRWWIGNFRGSLVVDSKKKDLLKRLEKLVGFKIKTQEGSYRIFRGEPVLVCYFKKGKINNFKECRYFGGIFGIE